VRENLVRGFAHPWGSVVLFLASLTIFFVGWPIVLLVLTVYELPDVHEFPIVIGIEFPVLGSLLGKGVPCVALGSPTGCY